MTPDPAEALSKAIAGKMPVTVVTTDGSESCLVEGQFIGPARPGDPGAFWVQPAPRAANAVKAWAAARTGVSVRFNVAGTGAGCETIVLKHITDYPLTDRLTVTALLLTEPTKLWLERRGAPRHQLQNDGGAVRAKLTRRAPTTLPGARPGPRLEPGAESRATIWDLGLGGAGFNLPLGRPQTLEGAPFEVTLQFASKQAVFPARIAYVRAQSGFLRVGMAFDHAAATPEANQLLKSIVSGLEQRTARSERRVA
jgi:hypothetical protein